MRLICPNCGAQYEVPDEVIPTSGRDVQCSDCGTTWFQNHPDHVPEPEEEAVDDWQEEFSEEEEPDSPEPDDTPSVDEIAASEVAEETTDEDGPSDVERMVEAHADTTEEFEEDYEDDEADEDPSTPEETTAFSRQLDPSVAEVLREEAALEASARATEQHGSLETQQDLGLESHESAAQQRSEEARSRMARLRGDEAAEDLDTMAESELDDQASRRNLLPDIDEINSSLGPDQAQETAAASADPSAVATHQKSGFRTGFRLAIVLAVLALLLYIFAPQLGNAVPPLAEPMAQYQGMVDGWRAALDGVINNFASSLSEE